MDLIFVDEEEADVILLFDEADPLLNRRSEVQYTNERYDMVVLS